MIVGTIIVVSAIVLFATVTVFTRSWPRDRDEDDKPPDSR